MLFQFQSVSVAQVSWVAGELSGRVLAQVFGLSLQASAAYVNVMLLKPIK